MKKLPLVSVIINTFNGEKFLRKSILSATKQTYKNLEIIIFDNKSKDKTFSIVKSIKDKRIKYYKSKKYLKLYAARNEAIKKSKGEYLAFLDSDDWWKSNKIEKQIQHAIRKNYDLVYSNYIIFNQKTKNKKIYTKKKLPEGFITQTLLNKYVVAVQTVLVKKKFFKNKMFNKRYEIIGDFDFFVNLSLEKNFGSIQKPLAFYRIHGSNYSIKKMHLHISEMKHWIRNNEERFKKRNLDIGAQKIYLKKLKIKNLFNRFV